MQNFKLIFILFLVVFIAIVIIQNTQPIQAKILFFSINISLILLLIIILSAGFILGILVSLYIKLKSKK